MGQNPPKYGKRLNLGGVAAEADDLLEAAFYQTANFETIESKSNKRCFIIGRTGSGKSAALSRIELKHSEDVIRINPENLALSYITNLDIIKRSRELNVNLELLWSSLWKHVFIIEIIRHRYKVSTIDSQSTILQSMISKIRKDVTKKNALDFFKEYENNFWEPSNERIRRFTEGFKTKVEGKAGASAHITGFLSGSSEIDASKEKYNESVVEEAKLYQAVVNENLLPQINAMINELNEEILHDSQNFTYLLIDDLDTYWVDEEVVTELIRSLFLVVMELKKVKNLKILIALRTNIFQELNFGKVKGFQEEKLKDFVVDMTWVPEELKSILDERMSLVSANTSSQYSSFSSLLPNENQKRGAPINYILDRTFNRPRDAITFANECLKLGIPKNSRFGWEDIYKAELSYSRIMITALKDEWRESYPGLEEVIEQFRGSPMRCSKMQFAEILDSIALLLATPTFKGADWLNPATEQVWNSKTAKDDLSKYRDLIKILFGVGFIGCSTRNSKETVFYYDDSSFMNSDSNFDAITFFNVHRAYQKGLEIKPKSESTY